MGSNAVIEYVGIVVAFALAGTLAGAFILLASFLGIVMAGFFYAWDNRALEWD